MDEDFNVISNCDKCKKDKLCKEFIAKTIDKKQKLYLLCKECIENIGIKG